MVVRKIWWDGDQIHTEEVPLDEVYLQEKDSMDTMDMDTMDFGDALAALKAGSKVARNGWNGKGMWLELQVPDEYSHMTLPYVYLNYPEDAQNTPGARVPWLASQTDMLAEDWRLFD